MDRYFIICLKEGFSPKSFIDNRHNTIVQDFSKEDAEQLVEELNAVDGKGSYYMLSIQQYFDRINSSPPIKELDKSSFNLGEELIKAPQIKQFLDKIYEANDNCINGLDLPKSVNNSDEYFKEAEEMLDSLANQIDKPAFNSQSGLKDELNAICQSVKKALKCAESGNIVGLDTALKDTIKAHFRDSFIVSGLDNNYAFRGLAPFKELHSFVRENKYDEMCKHDIEFFRARVSDEPITKQGEIVHLPYNLRNHSGNMRFSSKGQVCLYLEVTTFVCSEECQWKGKKDLYVSCFKPNEKGKKLKILNLTVSQYLINGISKNRDIQNKLLKIFPLVIATSFSINNPTNDIRHDYLISQRLISILNDLGIDGVAYLSCHGDSGLQYPHGVNLAIPVNDICNDKQYGDVCNYFSMTDPLAVNKLKDNISAGVKSTFINELYTEKDEFGFDDIISHVVENGEEVFYGKTSFSVWDNYLANQPFKDFIE